MKMVQSCFASSGDHVPYLIYFCWQSQHLYALESEKKNVEHKSFQKTVPGSDNDILWRQLQHLHTVLVYIGVKLWA